jgi:di/tricarboxylate transporter
MAGIGMVMTLYARWRRTENSREFWKKIGTQALIMFGGLIVLATTIQDYYRHLPPDHHCLSDYPTMAI